MKRAAPIALALLAIAAPVAAEPGAPGAELEANAPSPKNLVSLHLLSLDARSLSLGYERFVQPPKISIAGAAGVRRAASGDYSGWTTSAGVALRYWVTGWAAWSELAPDSMVGLFFAAQLDLARTALSDELTGRSLDSTLTIAEQLTIGYRFGFWGRLEVTPTTGVSWRHDIDLSGRLAPWTRGAVVFGLTVGYLF